MREVCIALGSNVGDAAANVRAAYERLKGVLENAKLSRLYASPPMYHEDQAWFVNAAAIGETDLDGRALLKMLKDMEKDMGREATFRNGPRLIDLDIVFLGDETVDEEGLHIPHQRLAERDFVLFPLKDLKPDWREPGTGRSVSAMLDALPKGELYVLAG